MLYSEVTACLKLKDAGLDVSLSFVNKYNQIKCIYPITINNHTTSKNTPNNKALLTGSWMVLPGTLLCIKNHIKTLLIYTYSVKTKHQANIQEEENPKKYKEKAH